MPQSSRADPKARAAGHNVGSDTASGCAGFQSERSGAGSGGIEDSGI